MKILVALSGGLDSAVVLASLHREHQCKTVGFNYGQRHKIELDYAADIARHYDVPFSVANIDHLPLVNDVVFAGRNIVLVGHAIALAHAEQRDAVAFGCNMSDWDRFPDCRPGFWSGIERAAQEAYGIQVLTPLLYTLKPYIVTWARKNGVPIDGTWSCYCPTTTDGFVKPCGHCLACKTREAALA